MSNRHIRTDRPIPNIAFKVMCAFLNLRNSLLPPTKILKEAGIKPGFCVLDYGCGPGGHSIAAAELVGDEGKVYALDIHPMALKKVQKLASDKGLANIETIHSDCATGLEAESLDMVLLYDIFHMLNDPESVLRELHRVLKPDATLSMDDHHMKEEDVVSKVEGTGLFKLRGRGEKTYEFAKIEKGEKHGRTRTNPKAP